MSESLIKQSLQMSQIQSYKSIDPTRVEDLQKFMSCRFNPNKESQEYVEDFLKEVPYFQKLKNNLPHDMYVKYAKKFEIRKFKKLEEVFEIFSKPKFFYVLVTGSVYVLIKKSGINV